MIAAPFRTEAATLHSLGTVTSIAFHAVTGAYALVGAIVAGACLAATLAVLVRGVGREVYESLTYDARGTSQG